MKYKILLKSLMSLALIITFSAQVYASEVTGSLSSSITESGSGSEVSGTIGDGTISGNVSGGSSSSGSSRRGSGAVLGASTGEVLGTTDTPSFPTTGLGPEVTPNAISLIGLILSSTTLVLYAYHRTKINA